MSKQYEIFLISCEMGSEEQQQLYDFMNNYCGNCYVAVTAVNISNEEELKTFMSTIMKSTADLNKEESKCIMI